MTKHFINVLIPTRERADLLESAIRSCVAQSYERCQFIISDNASSDDTREVVSRFTDARIVYVNPGRRISMAENFEFALKKALPGYVISIGDDDALMPDALDYLNELVEETAAEAIAGRWNCYFWNTYPAEEMQNSIYLWLGDGYSYRQSKVEVSKALAFNYSYVHKLAGLYYGLISTRLVDRLRHNGTFFQSITPDAYSAFACSLASEQFVFSHKPFVVAGLSGKSNGTSQLLNSNSSEADKFLKENSHPFHDSLAYCPAESIIMSEAFLQLERCHPQLTRGISISFERMCVAALRQASTNTYQKISDCVQEIARQNELSFDELVKAARAPDVFARLRKEFDEFLHPHYLVNLEKHQINEIASAALFAKEEGERNSGKWLRTWTAQQSTRIARRLARS